MKTSMTQQDYKTTVTVLIGFTLFSFAVFIAFYLFPGVFR